MCFYLGSMSAYYIKFKALTLAPCDGSINIIVKSQAEAVGLKNPYRWNFSYSVRALFDNITTQKVIQVHYQLRLPESTIDMK